MLKTSFSFSRTKLLLFLIMVLTLWVYAGSLRNGFVLDDSVVIVHNDFIKSWKNFPKLFGPEYLTSISNWTGPKNLTSSGEITYRPIITMTYFFDYHLWKLNPLGHHLTNLVLHLLCVLLLFRLGCSLLKNSSVALLAALIFAVHPANSETVSVITNRKDMVAFLFYASSFILFLKNGTAPHEGQRQYHFLSLLCFVLALLTKEMAMTLPFVLVLYDLFFVYNRSFKELLVCSRRRYGGYVLILLAYLALWFMLRGGVGDYQATYPYPGGSAYTNLCTMIRVVAVYIQWLFWPFNLHATLVGPSSFPPSYSFFESPVLFSSALILSLLAASFAGRKKAPVLSFSVFWFFIALIPVLNIIPLPMFIACRYLYIPSVAFSLGLASALGDVPRYHGRFVSESFLRRLVGVFIALLIAAYSFATTARIPVWNSNFSLSLEHARNYPAVSLTHINLASEFRKRGLWGAAIRECKVAVFLEPKLPIPYNELGVTWLGAGRPEEAIECFNRAIHIKPDFLPALYNLGLAYAAMQKRGEALRSWQNALRLAPGNERILSDLKKLEEGSGPSA